MFPHLLYRLVFLLFLLFPFAFSSYFLFFFFCLILLFTALHLLLSSAYSLSPSSSSDFFFFPECYIFISEEGHNIQSDSEGKVNIFGGDGFGHFEKKKFI